MVQIDYVPVTPSAVTDGKQIKVAGTTSGTATTLHVATSETQYQYDSVYIAAANNHTSDVLLTIEWGGTTAADLIVVDMPPRIGMVVVVPNHRIRNGLSIKAFASVADVVNVYIDAERLKEVLE